MAVNPVDFSRREFLKTGATVSGGLVIAIALPGCKPAAQASGETTYAVPNAWLRIGTDNSITFYLRQVGDGPGRIHLAHHARRRRARRGHRSHQDRVRAAGRRVHQQPDRRPDHRRQHQRARRLGEAAQGRRHGAAHARQRRRGRMGRRRAQLPGRRRRHHLAARQEAEIRRARRSRCQTHAAQGRRAQAGIPVHAGRQVAEAQGHAIEGGRQRRLRHRREAARHVVRRARATAGARRLGEDLQRREGPRDARRDRRGAHLFRCRRRRGLLVARAQGARPAQDRVGCRAECRAQRREDRPDPAQGRGRRGPRGAQRGRRAPRPSRVRRA